MSTKRKRLSRKADLAFLLAWTKKNLIIAELELEKIKLFLMFDWVKTQIFYENRKDFQYLYKTCGIAD